MTDSIPCAGNGSIAWRFCTFGFVQSSPVISPVDESIAFGRWAKPRASPLHHTPDNAQFTRRVRGSNDGNVYSLWPNGTVRWVEPLGQQWVQSSPAIDDNGTVYIGDAAGLVLALADV